MAPQIRQRYYLPRLLPFSASPPPKPYCHSSLLSISQIFPRASYCRTSDYSYFMSSVSLSCLLSCLSMILLSLTAHFVKSLSLFVMITPSFLRAACVPNSRDQKDARLLAKHLNTEPATSIYPSSLARSCRIAVFFSFLPESLRTDILHLTSNSRASSLDESPRKQASLHPPQPPPPHPHTPPPQNPKTPKTHTHTHTLRVRVKLWRVAGGVSHGGLAGGPGVRRDESGEWEAQRRRVNAVSVLSSPLLPSCLKTSSLAARPAPSFQEQPRMKEQRFVKQPNN